MNLSYLSRTSPDLSPERTLTTSPRYVVAGGEERWCWQERLIRRGEVRRLRAGGAEQRRRNRPDARTRCTLRVMSSDSVGGSNTEVIVRAPGNPKMQPGAPSVNPAGRPKRGQSLAERTRWKTDPDEVIDFWIATMRDTKAKIEARLAAAQQLADRGWGKPLATHELAINTGANGGRDWSVLPIEDRRALLEKLRAVPALGEAREP